MKVIRAVLLILFSSLSLAAQNLYCTGDTCTSSLPDGNVITCRHYPNGELECFDSTADVNFQAWRKRQIESFRKPGMTDKQAEAAFEAAMNKEPASVLAARHELCNKGILKADRCDFSEDHSLGYKKLETPSPRYSEGTPDELAAAEKDGKASKCIINIYPDGADVYLDDVKIGVSPLPLLTLTQHEKPRALLIKMTGYKDESLAINPDGSIKSIGVSLKKQQIADHT
jgi:hypothetical protein